MSSTRPRPAAPLDAAIVDGEALGFFGVPADAIDVAWQAIEPARADHPRRRADRRPAVA